MNSLDNPLRIFCRSCGHRADLPRSECDCPKCKPNPEQRAEQQRLDRESMRYLTAVDSGDFDTIGRMWDAAETDYAFAEMMHEIHAEIVREQDAGKVYRGYRLEGRVVVLVDCERLTPSTSRLIRDHSPDGFNWGYGGSGPAQLALAILFDLTGNAEIAQGHYQDFKRQFVAGWGDKWEITESQIREWLSLSATRAEES